MCCHPPVRKFLPGKCASCYGRGTQSASRDSLCSIHLRARCVRRRSRIRRLPVCRARHTKEFFPTAPARPARADHRPRVERMSLRDRRDALKRTLHEAVVDLFIDQYARRTRAHFALIQREHREAFEGFAIVDCLCHGQVLQVRLHPVRNAHQNVRPVAGRGRAHAACARCGASSASSISASRERGIDVRASQVIGDTLSKYSPPVGLTYSPPIHSRTASCMGIGWSETASPHDSSVCSSHV